MRGHMRIMLIALLALGTAFCSRRAGPDVAEPAGETTLIVENHSTLQVTVYVLRNSQRVRLGIATGLTTTRLRIPDNILFGPTPLRFELDPLASRQTPITEQITVVPGETVTLRVPSTLR